MLVVPPPPPPALVTVKLLALVARPPGAMRLRKPLVAPVGTVAVICEPESTVKELIVPLNFTFDAPVKLVPLITTLAPTAALAGVKLVIPGGNAPSTFARRTSAMSDATAVKKGKTVLVSI